MATRGRVRFEKACAVGFACVFVLGTLLTLAAPALAREGPGIEKRPAGFLYDPSAASTRPVFPSRTKLRQFGYFTPNDARCAIVITSYSGPPLALDEVTSAHEAAERTYSWIRYRAIEELKIAKRPAWGWLESIGPENAPDALQYVAVVSVADITYSIEFYANEFPYRDPVLMKQTVLGFDVVRPMRIPRWVIVVSVLVVLAGAMAWPMGRKFREAA
jgi:hypothetical protein